MSAIDPRDRRPRSHADLGLLGREAGFGAGADRTHCNAGCFAAVDWGTALAPIYRAHDACIPLHVWVVGVPLPGSQSHCLGTGLHVVRRSVMADNVGGRVMRHGRVGVWIVGADRTTASGGVANKVGTYLKAFAAQDNNVPFSVALPSPTMDWALDSGAVIPIRSATRAK